MGNQARVADAATVISTSTRNFPNRLGNGANVFLSSAELATAGAILGKLPTPQEYLEVSQKLEESPEDCTLPNYLSQPGFCAQSPHVLIMWRWVGTDADTYRYLNFHHLDNYVSKSEESHQVLADLDAK